LPNERWQFYNGSLAAVSTDTWYIHPGSPNLDGLVPGLASQRDIRLKEISVKCKDFNGRINQVRVHFRDGTHRWIMTANSYFVWGLGISSRDEPHYLDEMQLENVAYIAFDVGNVHASDAQAIIIGIRFEAV